MYLSKGKVLSVGNVRAIERNPMYIAIVSKKVISI